MNPQIEEDKKLLSPKAGILDYSRQNCAKIRRNCKLDYDPSPTKYKDLIINTLIKAQNEGKAKNTLISISHSLKQISKHADLKNPEEVKTYLAKAPVCNATKTKLCYGYNWFCKTF